MFWLVERKPSGLLGADPSAPLVTSRRSAQEKRPWRNEAAIENRLVSEFLRPALLGELIVPFRVMHAFEAIVPVTEQRVVLNAEAAANRGFGDLYGWLTKAEAMWNRHNKSKRTLAGQLDYIGQLTSQFPIRPLRLVYAASGTLPAACVVRDPRAVIEHGLYWMTPNGEDEVRYLAAIFNSNTARVRAAQYQSRGQWGARHFDKVIFNLPIPRFDFERRIAPQSCRSGGAGGAGCRGGRVARGCQVPARPWPRSCRPRRSEHRPRDRPSRREFSRQDAIDSRSFRFERIRAVITSEPISDVVARSGATKQSPCRWEIVSLCS